MCGDSWTRSCSQLVLRLCACCAFVCALCTHSYKRIRSLLEITQVTPICGDSSTRSCSHLVLRCTFACASLTTLTSRFAQRLFISLYTQICKSPYGIFLLWWRTLVHPLAQHSRPVELLAPALASGWCQWGDIECSLGDLIHLPHLLCGRLLNPRTLLAYLLQAD